ncbi:thionin-like protein 2 [Mangifera indica]|uniref:thionin-like protein 2 n=1 Tax=Mangifera indica TaxID=29780 RepID=UPI001CFB7219|nr:thionin-like protein 2 [Mangifera indica]
MERSKVGCVLMICLVMGILVGDSVGQSIETFKQCYAFCFITCVFTPGNGITTCATKCIKDCLIPHPSDSLKLKDPQYFCKLGCATALCTSFSSKDNPAKEKVGGCVRSCSKTCNNN